MRVAHQETGAELEDSPPREGGGRGDRGPRPERSSEDGTAPEFVPALLTCGDD